MRGPGFVLSTTNKSERKAKREGGREGRRKKGGERMKEKNMPKEDLKKTIMFYFCPLY